MPTIVRAHARKGTRGVRQHSRRTRADEPHITLTLTPRAWRDSKAVEGAVAYTMEAAPYVIFLHPSRASTANIAPAEFERHSPNVISHETLHDTLDRLGEHIASKKLDEKGRYFGAYPALHGMWFDAGRPRDAKGARKRTAP